MLRSRKARDWPLALPELASLDLYQLVHDQAASSDMTARFQWISRDQGIALYSHREQKCLPGNPSTIKAGNNNQEQNWHFFADHQSSKNWRKSNNFSIYQSTTPRSRYHNAFQLSKILPGFSVCLLRRLSYTTLSYSQYTPAHPPTIPAPIWQTNRLQPNTMRRMPANCRVCCRYPCLVKWHRECSSVQRAVADTKPKLCLWYLAIVWMWYLRSLPSTARLEKSLVA